MSVNAFANLLVRGLGLYLLGFAYLFEVTFDPGFPLIPCLGACIGFALLFCPARWLR